MKRIFYLLTIVSLVIAGCSKEEISNYENNPYTIEGYHTYNGTKTAFGTPGPASIPFVWSSGDKVWNGSQLSGEAQIESSGAAKFTFGTIPSGNVYYNMTGPSATVAKVPALQDGNKDLGSNGDFGYGTISEGSFGLTHATSYLWFDVARLPDGYTLSSITFDAGESIIAGSAEWNGSSFGTVSDGSSSIELTAGEGTMQVMVILPAELTNAKVLYKLTSGSSVKYAEKALGERKIAAGATYKINVEISSTELFERRVLTFEDEDVRFEPFYIFNPPVTISKWSDLIDSAQYNGELLYQNSGYYTWSDLNNTNLEHSFRTPYYQGGHAISKYVDASFKGDSYNSQLEIPIAAHSGSNFAVHYGYVDDKSWSQILQSLYFSDGEERVIESMYVTNTNYFLNSVTYGDDFNEAAKESTWINLVIFGYDSDGKEVGKISVPLVATGKQILMKWKRVDLTPLGKVWKIEFNFEASEDQCGSYGLNTPAYFAYDDVVVRF
ncbi:MAG: DUF4465 domain-containing protein [bacterium]|nr:DUF4465 domain-containing protein [bacterium]